MYDRLYEYTAADLQTLHQASMELLSRTGVAFREPEAVEIFAKHGARTEGSKVFIDEAMVLDCAAKAPEKFIIHARNPEKSVPVGGDDWVFLSGLGAPTIIEADGSSRASLMSDYVNFCKLIQTSPYLDMNGYLMVEPTDRPSKSAYLDMMLATITMSDMAFMSSPSTRKAAANSIEMAGIAFGGRQAIQDRPVMIPVISCASPLEYAQEMAAAIIEYAKAGQPVLAASCIMAGSSGPVTLAGVLAQQNAEVLAGMCLTELANPGTPFVYGATSCPIDMRTGGLCIGAVETAQLNSGTAQMARHYGLPCRSGGTLTDAQFPDMQAGLESALGMITAVRGGVNFILHSAGILGSFMAMSYEKFLIDEEFCGMVRRLVAPLDLSAEEIDVDIIAEVGIGGQFITHPKTFARCRTEFFMPQLMNRQGYAAWAAGGAKRVDQRAAGALEGRLEAWTKPDMDPSIEADLKVFVAAHS